MFQEGATHRAFLEIGVAPLMDAQARNVSGWEEVYYIVGLGNTDDLAHLLTAPAALLARCVSTAFG